MFARWAGLFIQSWPGLSAPSIAARAGVDGPDEPGHDDEATAAVIVRDRGAGAAGWLTRYGSASPVVDGPDKPALIPRAQCPRALEQWGTWQGRCHCPVCMRPAPAMMRE